MRQRHDTMSKEDNCVVQKEEEEEEEEEEEGFCQFTSAFNISNIICCNKAVLVCRLER